MNIFLLSIIYLYLAIYWLIYRIVMMNMMISSQTTIFWSGLFRWQSHGCRISSLTNPLFRKNSFPLSPIIWFSPLFLNLAPNERSLCSFYRYRIELALKGSLGNALLWKVVDTCGCVESISTVISSFNSYYKSKNKHCINQISTMVQVKSSFISWK